MISKTSDAYISTAQNLHGILDGVIMSVDPSIGSTSSMPGWAIYRQGQLVDSGIIEIPPHLSVWKRLRRLANGIRKLYRQYDPDVLVYEEIPAQRYGGGNAQAHASLLKALGVILSVPGPDGYVGIYPLSWKKQVRDTYVKGDEQDAREIGWIIYELAKQIKEGKDAKKNRTNKR